MGCVKFQKRYNFHIDFNTNEHVFCANIADYEPGRYGDTGGGYPHTGVGYHEDGKFLFVLVQHLQSCQTIKAKKNIRILI